MWCRLGVWLQLWRAGLSKGKKSESQRFLCLSSDISSYTDTPMPPSWKRKSTAWTSKLNTDALTGCIQNKIRVQVWEKARCFNWLHVNSLGSQNPFSQSFLSLCHLSYFSSVGTLSALSASQLEVASLRAQAGQHCSSAHAGQEMQQTPLRKRMFTLRPEPIPLPHISASGWSREYVTACRHMVAAHKNLWINHQHDSIQNKNQWHGFSFLPSKQRFRGLLQNTE